MPDYRITKLRGELAITFKRDGKRKRFSLGTADPREAQRRAPAVYAELTRVKGKDVATLWEAYRAERGGRRIASNMVHSWKPLADRFATMDGATITVADCRAHVEERRRMGIQDGTLCTELGHLRIVLSWAAKQGLIDKAPYIELPSRPKPKTDYITKDQARDLMAACVLPHLKLYVLLALSTGARNQALLDLTWDRCDLERGLVTLGKPDAAAPHKGRAVVPMTATLRAALQEARRGALSGHVIEWAGKPVASVKRGLGEAARRAGLAHVSPHMLRHSAAVHMAEAGIPMSEIAQMLGHTNSRITEQVYARYSPTYLRKAAAALEYDAVAEVKRRMG